MRKRLRRPSPAMIVALIALFVALSGIGYAAATIGTNDIENRAVTARKLHNKAVRTSKVKTGAITKSKIANGAVTKDKLAHDVLGSQRFVESLNGVVNQSGCQGGELGVRVTDGRGVPVDDRFTFQVPGVFKDPGEAFGQIRPNGSIRSSSANVTGVTHTQGSGTYCIQFSSHPGQRALESAVVSMHFN